MGPSLFSSTLPADKLQENETFIFFFCFSLFPRQQHEITFHLIVGQKLMGFGGLVERKGLIQCSLDPSCPNLIQAPLQILRVGEDGASKLFLRKKETVKSN